MNILQRSHIKYGLIMCLVLAACFVLTELTGQSFDQKSSLMIFVTYFAPIVVWYFGIRAKKLEQGNKLTYKQGIGQSFKIGLVYGLISPFIFLAYYLLFDMSLVEYARTAYGLVGASNTVVIAVDMVVQLVAAIIFGTIYGAILTLFLKTKS